jgi:hypothetical protein
MAEVDVSALFQLLGALATDMREMKADMREMKADIREIKATKADKADVEGLRQTVTQYHSAVLGHGFLISDLEDRVLRIERHLGLPPRAAE